MGLNVTSLGTGTISAINNWNSSNHINTWCAFGDATCPNYVWVWPVSVTPGGHVTTFQLDVSQAAGHIRVKIYDSVGGVPKDLIAQSSSLSVSGTGVQSFPISVTVPAGNTTIFAGFETDSTTLGLFDGSGTSGSQLHTYGIGPDPSTATPGAGRTPWN